MSKLTETNQKIQTAVVGGYQKVEDAVVGGYKKVEDTVVSGYQKVENKFIETFLTRNGETVEEARKRMTGGSEDDA